jgi:outer membrane protein assembly factor BamB
MRETNRRTLLTTLGTATVLGLAGCSSDGNDDSSGDETTSDSADATAPVHVNDLAWPSLRADPGNSGRSRVATAPESPPGEAWSFSPPDASGIGTVQYVPAVAEGTVYAPSHPDYERFGVYALDPASGETRWAVEHAFSEERSTTVVGNVGSAALDESNVYATDRGGVIAVSRDGAKRWTSDALLATPRTMNDAVYGLGAPSDGGLGVVGLEAETGAVRTHWESSGYLLGDVGFDADQAYVLENSSDSETLDLVAVSLSEETEVWRTAVNDHGEGVYPLYPVVHRNTVLVSRGPVLTDEGVSQGVLAVDADTGEERWSLAVGPDTDSNVGRIITAGSNVYVVERFASEPDAVRAYDLGDGSLQWETAVKTGVSLGDGAFAAGDTLYVPGSPMIAFSLADGTERWREEEEAWTAPFSVGNGAFYSPSAGGLGAYRP